jgi:membrane-associated protease RseP (regulator of RpoE activity)
VVQVKILLFFFCLLLSASAWAGAETDIDRMVQDAQREYERAIQGEPALPQTVQSRPKVVLGIRITDIGQGTINQYQLPPNTKGVLIVDVSPGYAGAAIGLRKGDILKLLNNQKVSKIDDVDGYLNSVPLGSSVLIVVDRQGELVPLTYTTQLADERIREYTSKINPILKKSIDQSTSLGTALDGHQEDAAYQLALALKATATEGFVLATQFGDEKTADIFQSKLTRVRKVIDEYRQKRPWLE